MLFMSVALHVTNAYLKYSLEEGKTLDRGTEICGTEWRKRLQEQIRPRLFQNKKDYDDAVLEWLFDNCNLELFPTVDSPIIS